MSAQYALCRKTYHEQSMNTIMIQTVVEIGGNDAFYSCPILFRRVLNNICMNLIPNEVQSMTV